MEYLLINRSSLQALCSSIGWKGEDGHYEISPDCLATLTSIEYELIHENLTTRNIRLSLGLSRIIERDLLCILETTNLHRDPPIIRVTVRLLVNLTLPPECLLPSTKHAKNRCNDLLASRIVQLQKILLNAKKAFIASNKATSTLINTMKLAPNHINAMSTTPSSSSGRSDGFDSKNNSDSSSTNRAPCYSDQQSAENIDMADKNLIKDCLLLFRNLLHVPDKIEPIETAVSSKKGNESRTGSKDEWHDAQRRIIWNLLVQGLDNTLLFLMSAPYRQYWICQIVQLIALLYKNQPVSKLNQYLCTKNSASDCSEDDVESDHTLSAQRSSSTSILSDSSSSKECGTQSSGSKNDSGYYQQTDSKRNSTDSVNNNTDSSMTNLSLAYDSSRPVGSVLMEVREESEATATNELTKLALKAKETSKESDEKMDTLPWTKSAMPENEAMKIDSSNENNEKCDNKNISDEASQETESKDTKEGEGEGGTIIDETAQTSGFSGSSEDDDRRMHKVMKPHQRCITKPSESEDSDDSDYMGGKQIRCHHHPPNVTRKTKNSSPIPRSPNCCPSICMEAAMAAALSQMTVSLSMTPASVVSQTGSAISSTGNGNIQSSGNCCGTSDGIKAIAPWEKKKTCGSKSSPIGNESLAPSDNDICSLLKEFTLKFVHNFFACLVLDLSKELLLQSSSSATNHHDLSPPLLSSSSSSASLDISHLLWLLSYFLKISSSIDLNYHHLSPILQTDMFGLLVYNGTALNEELEILSTKTIGGGPLPAAQTISPSFATHHQSAKASEPLNDDLTDNESIKKLTRKLQLLIAALKEMILTVTTYISKSSAGEDEKRALGDLRSSLAKMTDLRQFFLLLCRCYSPVVHPKSLLVDSIVTHHYLMILLDEPYHRGQFDLIGHLQQFATIKIMEQYGRVLETFQSNTELVNNCVFTVMHHVAGDLRNPECLFQPIILKTYSLIMESDLELLDSWEDLMEYVMNRFVKAATRSNAARLTNLVADNTVGSTSQSVVAGPSRPSTSSASIDVGGSINCSITGGSIRMKGGLDDAESLNHIISSRTRDATVWSSNRSHLSDESSIDLTKLDPNRDQLYWLYLQYEQTADPISCILEVISEEQGVIIGRSELITQLMVKGIISSEEYSRFLESTEHGANNEQSQHQQEIRKISESDLESDQNSSQNCHQNHSESISMSTRVDEVTLEEYDNGRQNYEENNDFDDDDGCEMSDEAAEELLEIDCLIDRLIKMGFGDQLAWIGSILIDTVNVKMCQVRRVKQDGRVLQPLAYFSNLLGQPVPIVPFNEKQELALNSKPMLELLQRIGFDLPSDVSKLYPRIPVFFTPDIMFKIACKISSPQTNNFLFKPEDILETGNSKSR